VCARRIRFQSVSHQWVTRADSVNALTDVTLELSADEPHFLCGPSGSGKSTLALIGAGLTQPSAGSVSMGTSGKRESNEPVALVFQNPELLFLEDSIRREFRAMHGPAADSVAAAWLARVDLDYASLADRIPFDVSAAEGRLIAAALQLSANPGVLILDEPTIGLDPRNRSHLVRLIDSWLTDDRLLVMITHDLRLMSHYGGRTHVLDAGRLAWSGPTPDLLRDRERLATYGLI